jgi:hypothetical protein
VTFDIDGRCDECHEATGRSPRDVRPDPDHIAMVNDMDVVPEDVRGADVGEARELLLDMLSDVCTNVHIHDYGALPGGIDLGKHADRILAALRSPEPAAEPSAEPATGRDQKMGVTEQELASAGGEPRYTLDEVADMLGEKAKEIRAAHGEVSMLVGWRESIRWLRSRGATT